MRSTTISIPSPCTQSWANMTPTTGGRHCSSCQETVADFTTMTDSEVIAFLRQYPSISCGQFRESQLSRPLLAAAQPVASWRRWLGATMAVLGIGSLLAPKVQAQAPSGQTSYNSGPAPISATEQAAGSRPEATPALASAPATRKKEKAALRAAAAGPDSIVISGVVHNRWGLRQAGARVHLSPSPSKPILTDEQGHFQLIVPRNYFIEGSTLIARYSNYDKKQYLITRLDADPNRTRPYRIHLKKQERIAGGKFR